METGIPPATTLPAPARILVVEDEEIARVGLMTFLELEGYAPHGVATGVEALAWMDEESPSAVLLDEGVRGPDGSELLEVLRGGGYAGGVVMMTARATVPGAVAALNKGADDYLEKPIDLGHLLEVLTRLRRLPGGRTEAVPTVRTAQGRELLARAPAMVRLVESLRTAASSDAQVLIHGETGTGKELVARLCHDWSGRASRPFVALHCAALAEGVLESELFGHERGAFTGAVKDRPGRFELADGGTLFLDELGEMPLATQVKLLRVLETGTFERVGGTKTLEVDVRVVSATNRDLEQEVAAGRFREDLFFRLNTITLEIPPLRDRPEDIPLLANEFVQRFAGRYQKRVLGFTPEALEVLAAYPWPGNVRELESTVERAVVFARQGRIDASVLPERLRGGAAPEAPSPVVRIPVGTPLREAERMLILRTLESCGGNKTQAARVLGISARKIAYKLKEWGEG